MKTLTQHIEHVKGKPHHIRKRVAFTIAASTTALIALVWLVGSISLGVFAIKGSTFADSTGEGGTITTSSTQTNTSGLAGAAAATASNGSVPAHIEIVDTTPVPANQKKAEQTIIPF